MFSLKLLHLSVVSFLDDHLKMFYIYLPVLVHVPTSLEILHYIGFDLYYCLVTSLWNEQELKHHLKFLLLRYKFFDL